MAGTAAIISAVAAVGSGIAANKQAKATNEAQKKAAKVERAQAGIEQQRRIRRAIAERRVQEADLLQAQEAGGTSSNSAITGAVGSLRTQTATNIGNSNATLSSQLLQSRTLQRGATRAARYGTVSNTLGSVSQATTSVASSPEAVRKFQSFFNRNG